jgi:hypothetical protein
MYNLTTFPVTSPLSHLGFGEFYDEKGLHFFNGFIMKKDFIYLIPSWV